MDIHKQLKTAGLHHSEITVYLYLLENGISTPPDVSRGTKIARTNCYNVLNDLAIKGLVEEKKLGLKKNYGANDPTSIIKYIEQRRRAVEIALPQLREMSFVHKYAPKFRYYDGLSGIQDVLLQSMQSREILSIGFNETTKIQCPVLFEWFKNELEARSLILNNITPPSKNITTGADSTTTPILIWNNKVAFLSLSMKPWGVIITNQLIANTIRSIMSSHLN